MKQLKLRVQHREYLRHRMKWLHCISLLEYFDRVCRSSYFKYLESKNIKYLQYLKRNLMALFDLHYSLHVLYFLKLLLFSIHQVLQCNCSHTFGWDILLRVH